MNFVKFSSCFDNYFFHCVGAHAENAPSELEFETQLVHLSNKHALRSPTCPLMLGLLGDNRALDNDALLAALQYGVSAETMQFEKSIRTCAIVQPQSWDVVSLKLGQPASMSAEPASGNPSIVCESMAATMPFAANIAQPTGPLQAGASQSGPIRILEINNVLDRTQAEQKVQIISFSKRAPPVLDNQVSFNAKAEFEIEPFAEFNLLDVTLDSYLSNLEGFQAPEMVIDDLIGPNYKHANYLYEIARENSFKELDWNGKARITRPVVEDLMSSGLFYLGREDSCRCFWCGVGLNRWAPTDDAWVEHARFSPMCPFVLRSKGRPFVKAVLIAEQLRLPRTAAAQSSDSSDAKLQLIKNFIVVPGTYLPSTSLEHR